MNGWGAQRASGIEQGTRANVVRPNYTLPNLSNLNFEVAEEYLRQALHGLMTPDEIENELHVKGLPPLAMMPDPDKFDPMADVWWSLPMALAWIIWRTPSAVREFWFDFRRAGTVWSDLEVRTIWLQTTDGRGYARNKVTGYSLELPRDLSMFHVFSRFFQEGAAFGNPIFHCYDARSRLWQILQNGEICAEGIPLESKKREPIRDAEWIDLDSYAQHDWPADCVGANLEMNPRYLAVRVRSAQVVAVWLPQGGKAESYRSGAPGRPSSKQLVIAEARRRLFADNQAGASLGDFARGLAVWLVAEYPSAPAMTSRTIENVIRSEWNASQK